MDNIGGFIGDNNNGMGQGLAYVLPNSRTESYAIQLNQEHAAQVRAQAQLLAKRQQEENDAYAKHLYENVIPEHDAKWDSHIQDLQKSYLNDAAAFHAKTGRDSYAQPQFVQRRNDILTAAKQSNAAAKQAVALSTQLYNDKDNKIDPADKLAAATWLKNYNEDPIKNSAAPVPTLNARSYDMNDAEKLLHPVSTVNADGTNEVTVPNRHAHVVQAQQILSDPKFDALKTKNGIIPAIGDVFSINDINGTHYPTDEPTVRRFAQHILADPALPGSVATLQAAGISPSDPNAEQKLTELGMKQNAGYGHLVSGLADIGDSKVTGTGTKRQFTQANYDLAERRLNRLEDKDAAGTGGAAPVPQDMNITYKNGAANVNSQNYIPLSLPKKNFAGSPAYSLTDGKQVKALQSSGDYEVVGVGNFPFIKGTGTNADGTVAQPNYVKQNGKFVEQRPMVHIQQPATKDDEAQDYLIDYDKLPANIKNSKPVQQALKNFHSAVTQPQVKQPSAPAPAAGGMIRVKLPNGNVGEIPAAKLHDFQRDYPGAQKID